MVMNFGMAGETAPAPLYMDVEDYAVLSDEAKHEIDQKTQSLLTDAYKRAAEYLRTHEKELHCLAEALVEYETLSAEEIQLAIKGNARQIAERRRDEASLESQRELSPKADSAKEAGSGRRARGGREVREKSEAATQA